MKNKLIGTLLFIVYLIVLIDFTLISDTFGRDIFNVLDWGSGGFSDYAKTSINLIPFATIRLMVNGIVNDNITLGFFLSNLLGNLLLLMPFGYFLPICTKFCNSFLKYFLSVSAIAISIELLQLLFLTGSCDVDDFILNVLGAVISYFIFKRLVKTAKV